MTKNELEKLVQSQAALIIKLQKHIEELEAELKKYKNTEYTTFSKQTSKAKYSWQRKNP